MKQQIKRFSIHQNVKVASVLMAVSSLIFVIPFSLVTMAMSPAESKPPILFFVIMPLGYLVMGYIVTVVGCALYNFMFKRIGGIEFETTGDRSEPDTHPARP